MVIFISILLLTPIIAYLLILAYICFFKGKDFPKDIEYIVVLGHALLPNGEDISEIFKDRINEAILLYEDYPNTKIVLAGRVSNGKIKYSKKHIDYILKFDINPNDILVEWESLNTMENLLNVRKMIPEKDLLFVTSGYHKARCKFISSFLSIFDKNFASGENYFYSNEIDYKLKDLYLEPMSFVKNFFRIIKKYH